MADASPKNIGAYIRYQCNLYEDLNALSFMRKDRRREITFGKLLQLADQIALGMRQRGLRSGQRVCIIGATSPEWLLAFSATQLAGAVDVAFEEYADLPRILQLLERTESRVLFCDRLPIVRDVAAKNIRGLIPVHLSWQNPERKAPYLSLSDLNQSGEQAAEVTRQLSRIRRERLPDDPASILFKRGDLIRPEPRGIILTHRGIMKNIQSFASVVPVEADDSMLLTLPLWHSAGRLGFYFALQTGTPLVLSEPTRFIPDLKALRPTLTLAARDTIERVFRRIHEGGPAESALVVLLRRAHLSLCRLYNRWEDLLPEISEGGLQNAPGYLFALLMLALLSPFKILGDTLLRFALRRSLGGRLRAILSGGAPLGPAMEDLFRMLRVPVLQSYWLTEAGFVVACRTLEFTGQQRRLAAGTVGPALPGVEVKIIDERGEDVTNMPGVDGQIFLRGPSVMQGYYQAPELTAEVLDEHGWLRTGDRGRITAAGDLQLLGKESRPAHLL
ncbi:MAG: AMP-binding protein [bacterium]|nr:AMP-binding protein [bacterium]